MPTFTRNNQGLSLVGVIIGIGLMILLFLGVFGMFRSSLAILFDSTARSGAAALMEERMEYIRSLPYRDVGTKNGIPPGVLEETETITLNDITYQRRTFVQFYDDPADGTGASDDNNVTQDYKRAKVAVTWEDGGRTRTIESASFIMPNGIETSQGGGTLSIRVFDAVGSPVENAEINIANASTSPAIDTTTFTDGDGKIRFSGAPAAAGYEVSVSKSGYSQSRTYDRTSTNVDPSPGHLTVATSSVTTASFPIDELSTVNLQTLTPIKNATDTISFVNPSAIASSSNTTIDDGQLRLATAGSGYATSGVAYTRTVGTSSLYRWQETQFNATTSPNTDMRLYVVSESGGDYTRLTDSELSGNDAGFTSSPIDISDVSTSTYSQLAFELRLNTSATSTTPRIGTTTTKYRYGRAPLPNVNFDIRGDKTIGEKSNGDSIYKQTYSTSTEVSGKNTFTDLEWDAYTFTPTPTSDRRIASACPAEPLNLAPATTTDLKLAIANIASDSDHSLRVVVNGGGGDTISGATTTLSASTTAPITKITGPCGQTFYGNLDDDVTYDVSVFADGYASSTEADVTVSGAATIPVQLTTN
jgi:hypothetical protein